MKKKLYICASLLLVSLFASAQTYVLNSDESYNAVQLQLGANFHYSPVRGLTIQFGPEVYLDPYNQFNDTLKLMQRLAAYVGLEYKVNKYFKAEVDYKCLGIYHNAKSGKGVPRFWEAKHRVMVSATGLLPIGRFTLSLREQFRTTFRPMINNETYYTAGEKQFAVMMLRTRLKLAYKLFSKPIEPFLSVEMSNQLNQHEYVLNYLTVSDYWLSDVRTKLGIEWKLDGYSSFTFYYEFLYGKEYDVDIKKSGSKIVLTPQHLYRHAIGVYYTLKF